MSLAVKSGRSHSREGLVRRPRLLKELIGGSATPLVLLVAPAGYGKTSLLAEWAAQDTRASMWLSLEPWHDDPLALLQAIVSGLEELAPVDPRLRETLDEPGSARGLASKASSLVLSLLAAELESRIHPLVLIIDDVQALSSSDALQVLATVAEHLPLASQLVLASRARPVLPLGRLRAHGALLELGADELAMTRSEASSLLRAAGIRVRAAEVDTILRRTQGWPAGLCLAALCAREEGDSSGALARFAGDDRVVADYLRDEFLSGLSREDVDFLLATSILEELSGPPCDAVLARTGSARVLDRLAQSGVPLRSLDRSGERYRCHPLLRDMLLAELQGQPECAASLHLRACAWHRARRELDSALAHAIAAGDASLAGDLLWESLPRQLAAGRPDVVRGWLARFSAEDLAGHPSLALTAAHSALASGDLRQAEHWGLIAAGALGRSPASPSAASLPAGVAVIQAATARRGIVPMGAGAARAGAREQEDSPWRAVFSLLQGVADHLTGDRDHAREHLEDGIHRSSVAAPPVETLCLSQLAIIAVEEGDWDQGVDLIARAVDQVERHDLVSYPSSALTFAVSAHVRSEVGHVDEGKRDARRAAHLLAGLSDFIPWYEAETRIALARAALRLADIRAARTLLAEASQLARRVPDAILFGGWLEETWGLVDSAATLALAGPATLTLAELRILRFLPTHLSFREIGARLHVSTNTVKTQAHAVYRKLDVSSRSQAVARAADIGLLEG
jgi:LuxR family maltose regulon positive regulatory protein